MGCRDPNLKWGKNKCREQEGNNGLVRGAEGFGGKAAVVLGEEGDVRTSAEISR